MSNDVKPNIPITQLELNAMVRESNMGIVRACVARGMSYHDAYVMVFHCEPVPDPINDGVAIPAIINGIATGIELCDLQMTPRISDGCIHRFIGSYGPHDKPDAVFGVIRVPWNWMPMVFESVDDSDAWIADWNKRNNIKPVSVKTKSSPANKSNGESSGNGPGRPIGERNPMPVQFPSGNVELSYLGTYDNKSRTWYAVIIDGVKSPFRAIRWNGSPSPCCYINTGSAKLAESEYANGDKSVAVPVAGDRTIPVIVP